jgi:hypothetical protein
MARLSHLTMPGCTYFVSTKFFSKQHFISGVCLCGATKRIATWAVEFRLPKRAETARNTGRAARLRFLGEVEEAEEAALGGEGVDVGEELLEAVEISFAF